MSPRDIWQVEYSLYIKFACSYLKEYNAIPGTIEHGFFVTIYSDDLKAWSLKRMKQLTTKASQLRNKRTLDDSVLKELKSLPGYRQLVELMKN